MNRDDLRTLIADYLDDLLVDDEARAAEDALARHPELRAEVERMRAVVYHPYTVAPAAPAPAPRRRWPGALRYAAAFAAGVLVTLLVRFAEPAASPSTAAPKVAETTPPPAPPVHNLILR